MTAHVLVPALDEQRPATLVEAHRDRDCCARSWAIEGVILSDDLEMKAVARDVHGAGGGRAGGRGRLRRRADLQRRPRDAGGGARGADPRRRGASGCRSARVEDALDAAAAGEGALSRRAPSGAAAPPGQALRQMLGRDEHRAIADEMARFA